MNDPAALPLAETASFIDKCKYSAQIISSMPAEQQVSITASLSIVRGRCLRCRRLTLTL